MKKWTFVFVLLSLLASTTFSQAQEQKPEELTNVTMEEVVVTATKTEEKRKDIPNSVILMDEIDIEESSAKSLGELLANELGVDWRTYGNYGGAAEEVHIRGMSANATQVFVNGVNINSPSLGIADVSGIPLNNIERIEVVKGSGSLLYGSGAMGGTISIITKRPERDKMDFKVTAGYGSDNTYLISAEQGMFALRDFGYYLTATRRETDGFRDNSDLTHNDVSLKLVFDKGDALDISLYGDYIDREHGRPGVKPSEGTQDYFIGGTKFYNSKAASLLDKGGDEDAHFVLQIKSSPTKWTTFKLQGDYADMENYNYSRYNFSGAGGEVWTTNEVFGAEGNMELKPYEGANLLLGMEYKHYDWQNESVDLDATGAEVSGTRSSTKADLHTTGTFSEAQYRPSKYFKVLAGIRHEDHSEFGTEYLPLYGLVLNPFENTTLKVSHGKHFLAPTPNDLFWPREDWGWGTGAEGNRDLRPEMGWHSDVTLEQALFRDKVFITVSYFDWDIQDRILWADDGTGFWMPTNLKSYEADGIELGGRMGPFFDFTLCLNYTYLDAKEEAEEYSREIATAQKTWKTHRAIYSPKHQFKGSLGYESPFGLMALVTVRYVSARLWYRDETTNWVDYRTVAYHLDSYWTTDLKIGQRFYDHWILALQGSNLFDKGYDTYLSTFRNEDTGITTVQGYPGAGRSLFLSVTYEY
jgi:iron complex outermembrane receptor protein